MRYATIRRAVLETLESRLLLSTYYVSPSGNDGAAGSSAAPFATIQRGVSVLNPGDTLDVKAGTYTAGFVIGWDPPNNGLYSQISGTQQAPITIQADPSSSPGSVIITGANNKTHDGIDFEGGDPSGCNWITVKGFTINNASGSITRAGIRISGGNANVSLIDNVTTNCGTWGIFSSFSTGLLVQGNTCSDSQTQHGIYISNSDVGAIVRGNTVFGNALQGIHFNGDASQGGTGIDSGELVEDNIIYDNGGNGINCDGVQNSRIQNNLIYGNGNNGISLYQIDAAAGCTNNAIVNNTILDPTQWAIKLQDASTGNTIYNNILYSAGNGSIDCYSDCLSGLHSDYNIIMNDFSDDGNDTQIPLTQWISDTGQDQHSILAPGSLNSLFASPSTSNYQLVAGSPAVGAGVGSFNSMMAPTTDLAGNPRPTSAGWDIGAYEYQSGAVTTPPPALTLSGASTNIAGSSFSLTLASSDSGNDQMTSWLIHWGDGTSSTIAAGSETLSNGVWVTSTTGTHVYSTSATYTISATATDGAGTYAAGNSVSVAVVAPGAPSGLFAVAVSSSGINLSWTVNSNITGFLIERSTDGVTFTQIASVAASSTSYSDSGLAAATTYTYRVRATSSAGDTAYSNTASAKTSSSTIAPAPPSVPAAPSAMSAQVVGSSQINLSWTETSNNATGFLIERSSDGTTFTQVGTTGANVYSYTDSGLTAGTTYYYRVIASSSAGNSTPSTTISATTAVSSTGVAADRQKVAGDHKKLSADTQASRLALASDRKLIASTKAADLSILASDRRTIARNRSSTAALDASRETFDSDIAKFRADVASVQATLKADVLHWKQAIQADKQQLSADLKQLARDLALAKATK